MSIDFLKCQYDEVMQPARRSAEQFFYYENVSIGHFLPRNCEGLAGLSDKVVQNN